MKKMIQLLGFIALLALFAPAFAFAGIESGDWRIAAGISTVTYDETKIDGTKLKTTTFAIAPNGLLQIGKVFGDRIELGIKVGAEAKFFVAKDASIDIGLFISYLAGDAKSDALPVAFRRKFDLKSFTIGP